VSFLLHSFQDEKLKRLVGSHGDLAWEQISHYFADKTDLQCKRRWDKALNPELSRGPWTKEVRFRMTDVVCESIHENTRKSCPNIPLRPFVNE